MILSGGDISDAYDAGIIKVTPWNPEHLNPASYDLTLGTGVAVYDRWVHQSAFLSGSETAGVGAFDGRSLFPARHDHRSVLDCKEEPAIKRYTIGDEGWLLQPGIGYLMHTAEQIWTTRYVPVLDGKSSIGRLFIKVHETAGYGDPGFDGQYTLEVTAQHPVRVYAGMRIAQIRFHMLSGNGTRGRYAGNYRGDAARGAQPSRIWKSFLK